MDHRNVVLVSIDSLRADHCGYLGDDRGLTPTMDTMAADGVAFETAVAPGPQTFSSMPAAFTGRYRPQESPERYPGDTHWERRLAAIDEHMARHPSLPERLRDLGYDTAGISPNPWTSSAAGFDRGFDRFTDVSGQPGDDRLRRFVDRLPGVDADSKAVELTLDVLTGSSFFARWETLYEEVEAAREQLSEPYFLWVFLLDTHYPFLPTREHRQEQSLPGMYASALYSEAAMRGNGDEMSEGVCASMQRSYRDTVRAVDAFLERLRADAAEDDPVTIVHSDHGESFGERGNYGHHHRNVYEENVHVPYLVHGVDRSATVADPVSLASLPDVALAAARTGTVDPAAVVEPSVVTTSECGRNRAVRSRRFKYLECGDETALFDLESDPDEETDVADSYPVRYERLRARLEQFRAHCEATRAVSDAARAVAARTLR